MNQDLKLQINRAITLIQLAAPEDGSPLEVAYSGGKDSDVILDLTKKAGVNFRAIYKNTTIDPPHTIAHCLKNNVEINEPTHSFLWLVEHQGMPTRRVRHCCRTLKEYKILDTQIQGIRRMESTDRQRRYNPDDPIICRVYGAKSRTASIILPILNWTDAQLSEYISINGIQCHPLYYDEYGTFHVERRLGCIGCPMQSDRGAADYKQYPKLLKRVVSATSIWWDTHPSANSHNKFPDVYGLIGHNLFYRTYEKWKEDTFTLFGQRNWKEYLQDYFQIEL